MKAINTKVFLHNTKHRHLGLNLGILEKEKSNSSYDNMKYLKKIVIFLKSY